MFKLKRMGMQPVKVMFSAEVQSVHFPGVKEKDLSIGAPVSVCFERGGKMVSTGDHSVVAAGTGARAAAAGGARDLVADIGETLRLVATLYRTGSNQYQEKTGKIVVRYRREGEKPKSANAFKGIGVVKLQLNSLARSFEPCKLTLALEQCSTPGVVVNIIVTAKVMGDGEDDTMSQMSGTSDISCGAADFSESFGIRGLGGIAEETDRELLGDDRSPYMAERESLRDSDLGRPGEFERPTEVFDRLLTSSDASKIGRSPLVRSEERKSTGDSSQQPSGKQSALVAEDPPEQITTESAESEEERESETRGTFSLQKGMPFISQSAYDDKIKEILKLRSELDHYTGDLSRTESKLATANMLVNAETKRSKKLKEELLASKKEHEELNHKLSVMERSKALSEDKIKALEADNKRMKLLLATQRHLTDAVAERHEESQEMFKSVLDQKVELESLKDQLADVVSDRDVYKAELEQTREELSYLRSDLASRGIDIPPEEERYEEDKDNVISALRSQLGSLQILAEEEKTALCRQLDGSEAKIEKMKLQFAARESELKKAGVQALAVAKEAWGFERVELEKRLNSSETDVKEMIQEIDELRVELRNAESRLSAAKAEKERSVSPTPPPSKSSDGPAPMLRQLSKMTSIKAFANSSKNLNADVVESDDHQRQIDALTASHNNAISVLSKELDALRTRVSLQENELDSADRRYEALQHELKLTKMELWETLDRVDNSKPTPPPRTESLRISVGSMNAADGSSALLDQLIVAKMDYATLANVRDVDRLETFELKRRVQGYAERVAKLEVQLALANERNVA